MVNVASVTPTRIVVASIPISRNRQGVEALAELGVAGGHLARIHLVDAIHQIQSGSPAADHFAIQILTAANLPVALRNRRQIIEKSPVILHFGAQAGKLRGVRTIENGGAILERAVGIGSRGLPVRKLGRGVACAVRQKIGSHRDGGLIDPSSYVIEGSGAAQI